MNKSALDNASKSTEIEARWINLDKESIIARLDKLGAKKTGDYFFKEWIFAYPEWTTQFRRVRIRTDGTKTWLTYKANATWAVDSTEEVEFEVPSAEDAVTFMHAIGMPLSRAQEKKRASYELDGITFDLDTWPKIPMVLEIEADTEASVREGARLLGLEWKDAIFEDQLVVHRKHYGIDLHQIKEYKF